MRLMPQKDYRANRPKKIQIDGLFGRQVVKMKPGDPPFIKSVVQLAGANADHLTMRKLRRANRGQGSSASKAIGVRIKADAWDSVENRAKELGMTVSEYIRSLIYADIEVMT